MHIKKAIIEPPMSRLQEFTKSFTIDYDAFKVGLGPILTACYSKALKDENLLFSTYENEILAIVSAINKWRPYFLS